MHNDKINPDHYFTSTGAEVIDITEDMSFCLGNVVKYCQRAGKKPGESNLDDLNKALWYLQREIRRLEQNEQEQPTSPNYRHVPPKGQ